MMNLKTLCLLLLFSALFTASAAAQQKQAPQASPTPLTAAKKFESKQGNFSINITGTPTQTRNLASETAQKKSIDVGQQFFWQFEKTIYTVMYSNPLDANGNASPLNLDAMNAGSRKGIATEGAKLVSEKNIAYGKYQGTEFRSSMPSGVKFISRNFLIGKVGYLVSGGYVDDKDEKAVLEVLNSFKLLVDSK